MAFACDCLPMLPCAKLRIQCWLCGRPRTTPITTSRKYGTKALEQLQNLIAQFALGLRRLEIEEQQERDAGDAAVLANPEEYKRRARRVTLRLAMAANRATWASCCEMASFIRTTAHVRKSYLPRDIYLSRLAYLCHTCLRLLNSGESFLLEASDLVQDGTTNLSTVSFSTSAAQSKTTPLSNVLNLPTPQS